MKISNKINKSNVFLVFLIYASILILPKWILSYYFFDENIVLRIIKRWCLRMDSNRGPIDYKSGIKL